MINIHSIDIKVAHNSPPVDEVLQMLCRLTTQSVLLKEVLVSDFNQQLTVQAKKSKQYIFS
jgi:hypothetical protein